VTDANVAVSDSELEAFRAWKREQTGETASESVAESAANDVPMIVHHEKYMEGTVQHTRVHGPMPASEWPAYEKAHGF